MSEIKDEGSTTRTNGNSNGSLEETPVTSAAPSRGRTPQVCVFVTKVVFVQSAN